MEFPSGGCEKCIVARPASVRGGRCEADWIGQRGEPRCSLEDRDCQGMPLTTVSNAWREDGREAWLPSQGKPIRGRPALGNGRRHETRQGPGRRRPRGPSAGEEGKPPVGCVSAGRRQSRSLRQQSHPARFVAGAGNLWHAYAHKGSPLFRRRAPARNTLGPRGLLTARAAARRQEAPRGRGGPDRRRPVRLLQLNDLADRLGLVLAAALSSSACIRPSSSILVLQRMRHI